MSILFIILSVVYILVCVGLIATILLQKKRSSGLGGLAGMGMTDTYFDRNKGRTMEGKLEKLTKVGVGVYFVLTLVMCVVK